MATRTVFHAVNKLKHQRGLEHRPWSSLVEEKLPANDNSVHLFPELITVPIVAFWMIKLVQHDREASGYNVGFQEVRNLRRLLDKHLQADAFYLCDATNNEGVEALS